MRELCILVALASAVRLPRIRREEPCSTTCRPELAARVSSVGDALLGLLWAFRLLPAPGKEGQEAIRAPWHAFHSSRPPVYPPVVLTIDQQQRAASHPALSASRQHPCPWRFEIIFLSQAMQPQRLAASVSWKSRRWPPCVLFTRIRSFYDSEESRYSF